MQETTLDTQRAPCAFFAARDARMRNYAQSSTYTEAQRRRAEQVRLGLGLAYSADEIHINYRGKFIAVKLANARVRDRATQMAVEAMYALEGIVKRVTAQGIIYRIPRSV